MKLTAQNVNDTFLNCLYETTPDDLDKVHIISGVNMRVGFDPNKLKDNETNITQMLSDLSDDFKKTGGGGMSFLNACVDKEGNHWAEHQTIDKLVCLGLATGKVEYSMPREMWSALPGGMPYIVVND